MSPLKVTYQPPQSNRDRGLARGVVPMRVRAPAEEDTLPLSAPLPDVYTRGRRFPLQERCPPRQMSRVERLEAKVKPLSTVENRAS